jgi:hypothetical protein
VVKEVVSVSPERIRGMEPSFSRRFNKCPFVTMSKPFDDMGSVTCKQINPASNFIIGWNLPNTSMRMRVGLPEFIEDPILPIVQHKGKSQNNEHPTKTNLSIRACAASSSRQRTILYGLRDALWCPLPSLTAWCLMDRWHRWPQYLTKLGRPR